MFSGYLVKTYANSATSTKASTDEMTTRTRTVLSLVYLVAPLMAVLSVKQVSSTLYAEEAPEATCYEASLMLECMALCSATRAAVCAERTVASFTPSSSAMMGSSSPS